MVLDSISNDFNTTYAAWPLRFFLIDNGLIEHIPMPTNGSYNPRELDDWLLNKGALTA